MKNAIKNIREPKWIACKTYYFNNNKLAFYNVDLSNGIIIFPAILKETRRKARRCLSVILDCMKKGGIKIKILDCRKSMVKDFPDGLKKELIT